MGWVARVGLRLICPPFNRQGAENGAVVFNRGTVSENFQNRCTTFFHVTILRQIFTKNRTLISMIDKAK